MKILKKKEGKKKENSFKMTTLEEVEIYMVYCVRIVWFLAIILLFLKDKIPLIRNISRYGKLSNQKDQSNYFKSIQISRKQTFLFE